MEKLTDILREYVAQDALWAGVKCELNPDWIKENAEPVRRLLGYAWNNSPRELLGTCDHHPALPEHQGRHVRSRDNGIVALFSSVLHGIAAKFEEMAALAHPEKVSQPAPRLQGHELMETTDAQVWAEQFCARFGGDKELMLSWFASAIMVGYDKGRGVVANCGDELQSKLDRAVQQTEGKQP